MYSWQAIGTISFLLGRPSREAAQQGRYLLQRQAVVDINVLERALRHPGERCLVGVLDDRHATTPLYGQQACCPIVEGSSQDHPNYSGAVSSGRGAEKGIHCWPVTVLLRPAHDADVPRLEEHVKLRWRDVDLSALYLVPVFGMHGRE